MTATCQPPRQYVVNLEDWIAVHGPLWPSEALVIAFDALSRASRMPPGELAATLTSLDAGAIRIDAQGGWRWQPAAGTPVRTRGDTEVLERVGALLFRSLTGQSAPYPHGGSAALRASMRQLRPDLPAPIVDLTVEALTARPAGRRNLQAYARLIRQTIGVGRAVPPKPARTRLAVGVVGLAAVLAASTWWLVARPLAEQVDADGFTVAEIAAIEATAETAETFALIDEHTAAIQQYHQLGRLLRTRVGPADARLSWNNVREAWVRTMAGDRLTTEQILEEAPARLIGQLGETHPYVRAARLGLAATLKVRGAIAEASKVTAQAEIAAADLLRGTTIDPERLDPFPVPAGLLAHVVPTPPEREGFRRLPGGQFGTPLTSTQRHMAGKNGWRLHLVAPTACRASIVTGNRARRVAVAIVSQGNRDWRVEIEGTANPIVLRSSSGGLPSVSVIGNPSGEVRISIDGKQWTTGTIDTTSTPSPPPHVFAFDADADGGASRCQIAWFEIIYPPNARFPPTPEM